MRTDLQLLAALGVDPATLDEAPDGMLHRTGWQARVHPLSPTRRPCTTCGAPAYATCRLDLPELGLRWLDSCRDHMLAVARLRWP